MFSNRIELAQKVFVKIEIWRDYLFDDYKNREDFHYRVDVYRCLWRYLNQLSLASATSVLDDNVYLLSVDNLFDISYSFMVSTIDNISFIYVTDINLNFDL